MSGGGKRGLGRQAPAVLAAPRRAPGVLAKMGSPIVPELAAVRAMQTSMGKLKTAHEDLRADLADALDGWEALAGASDQARIDALRKRWELEAADRSVGEQDLTDGTAES